MNIAIYATCRNEEANIEGFLENCKDADSITVCDTGSTDASRQLFSFRCNLFTIKVEPFRFDVARNTALALVSPVADICVRLDLDERLESGWREALERAWVPGIRQLWYKYNYSPGFSYHSNHVHARDGFVWKGIAHEALYGGCSATSAFADDFEITHYQSSRQRGYVLERLQLDAVENKSARTLYYVGREYFYHGQWTNCIEALKEGLSGDYKEQQMDAMIMISKSYFKIGYLVDARSWGFKAIAEYETREPYFSLAEMFPDLAYLKDYSKGLDLPKMTSIFQKPECWI